jgi:hypothetical protein
MTDNIVKFYPSNAASNPDNVLEQAVGDYKEVLILGWNKDGDLDVRSSLGLDYKDSLWLVSQFKSNLLRGIYFV